MTAGTILVIEDNALNSELIRDLLETGDFSILQAGSAEEGLEMVRRTKPDLILMDCGLPGISGLRATVLLKNDPATADIPVIVLTAHAMKGDEKRAFEAGCDGYMVKPIDVRQFVPLITRFLHERSSTSNHIQT